MSNILRITLFIGIVYASLQCSHKVPIPPPSIPSVRSGVLIVRHGENRERTLQAVDCRAIEMELKSLLPGVRKRIDWRAEAYLDLQTELGDTVEISIYYQDGFLIFGADLDAMTFDMQDQAVTCFPLPERLKAIVAKYCDL